MQNFNINSGNLPSSIDLPPSKSYANRVLILASLKKNPVKLFNMPEATDVTFLINALLKIGLKIEQVKDSVSVLNHFPECEKNSDITIEVGEGGTTARFLASLLLLGNRKYTLILGERLKHRPWTEFLNLAISLGAKASLKDNELFIQGPITNLSEIQVDCSETTQFASGLQLALAFSSTKVTPLNMLSSQSYFAMTKVVIQKIENEAEFTVPMDWSSASYPMCFAALKHPITFPGLKYDAFQSDSKLFFILKELGCLEESEEGIKVSPTSMAKDFNLDVSDCLDLVPALAFLLTHIKGSHILKGLKNLEYKESHRLEEVLKLIKIFGREASSDGSNLLVKGSALPIMDAQNLSFPDDHRMVMAGALFLRHHQGGALEPASAVAKSYPNFFNLF